MGKNSIRFSFASLGTTIILKEDAEERTSDDGEDFLGPIDNEQTD